MWKNAFMGNPANLLKISTLPYTCESYAEKHPESPLYHELMALNAFWMQNRAAAPTKSNFNRDFLVPQHYCRRSAAK